MYKLRNAYILYNNFYYTKFYVCFVEQNVTRSVHITIYFVHLNNITLKTALNLQIGLLHPIHFKTCTFHYIVVHK